METLACNKLSSIRALLVLITAMLGMNVYGQILNEDYAAGADVLILKNEMDIFSTIEQGVRLSVAECELFENCAASVNPGELDQLITTINSRINALSLRYTDSGEAGLEEVLVAYVDIRDSYNEILGKIESMPQFEVEEEEVVDEFGFDDFFGFGPAAASEISPEIQELFEDVDEEIVDDDLTLDEEDLEIQ